MAKEITMIGKTIYATLKDLVDNKVYPLVAEQTTSFPFIIYRTSASRPTDEKDSVWCNWEYNVTIDIVDDNYDDVVEICDEALEELYKIEGQGYVLEVNSVNETYQDNAYVREIEIVIKK